ncbi:lymphocyte antigen 96 [Tachyglossus aculeatus]|uniref:lymphocyte antigen 96 n=1 Tax=Tachyglossus aculeatus TaxID=9261 RepID=UPI0018F4BDC0|nr:lymphocyte antigen 96 [Tachyglossus aculeatus]
MFPLFLWTALLGSAALEGPESRLLCTSPDLSISYSFCGGISHMLSLGVKSCLTKDNTKDDLYLFFVPKRDIIELSVAIQVWFKAVQVAKFTEPLCRGFDDEYSFCGVLKGETINITVPFSYRKFIFPQGQYTVLFEGISGRSNDLIFCVNATVILK